MSSWSRVATAVVIVGGLIVSYRLFRHFTACARHVTTFTLRDDATGVTFSPDGSLLAVGQWDDDAVPARGAIEVFDLKTNQKLFSLPQKSYPSPYSFSPDGKYLAAIGDNVVLYDARMGRTVRKLPVLGSPLRFSHDGHILAGNMAALRHKTVSNKAVRFKTGKVTTMPAVAFSLDDKTIATSGQDNLIRVWDVNTGQLKKTLKGHRREIQNLTYLMLNGKAMVASFDLGGVMLLWDASTGKLQRKNAEQVGSNCIDFAPKAGIYAVGGWGTGLFEQAVGWIDIREIRTNKEICAIRGLGSVYAVSLSPDGKQVAFGGDDEVQVWQIK
jgi:WD40 repeat protein